MSQYALGLQLQNPQSDTIQGWKITAKQAEP